MKKLTILSLSFMSCLSFNQLKAQGNLGTTSWTGQQNVVTTTVPYLLITPDSRSGGMADAGVAITPDANSMHWNPAKLAFAPNDLAVSVSYTPWLRQLVPDISLSYLSMYKKIDNLSGFGASLRYFSLGDITFTGNTGEYLKTYRPNEFALDAGYARKLSEHFSIGVAGRFIYSDLAGVTTLSSGEATKPAVDFAGDISAYYTKKIKVGGNPAELAFGANISNIGGKITYTDAAHRDFIPTNLKLGGYLNVHINEYNDIGFALDFNKLLVPTPPVYLKNSAGTDSLDVHGNHVISFGKDPNQPVISGMIQSFYDAPGGFREELAEINPSIGIEYWYAHQIAGRIGFFYEDPGKGNRQYMTFGIGVRYTVFNIDLSYLVPTNGDKTTTRSPLENTLRFTLAFNFDKGKVKKTTKEN
jgi:hypothetical protein